MPITQYLFLTRGIHMKDMFTLSCEYRTIVSRDMTVRTASVKRDSADSTDIVIWYIPFPHRHRIHAFDFDLHLFDVWMMISRTGIEVQSILDALSNPSFRKAVVIEIPVLCQLFLPNQNTLFPLPSRLELPTDGRLFIKKQLARCTTNK